MPKKKNVTSVLEVMDITTGQRSVVKEFPFLIEAPNWTPDGNWLVYNSGGKLYKLSPESPGEPQLINSDYATRCNNDHVISADGKQIAISNGTKEDGKSRVIWVCLEPSAFMRQTCISPVRTELNQIYCPQGEYSGPSSKPSAVVRRFSSPPRAGMT